MNNSDETHLHDNQLTLAYMVATRRTTGILGNARQDALAAEEMSARCHCQRLDRVETDDAGFVGGVRDPGYDGLKVGQRSLMLLHR